ncbi:pectate lyase-like adhesive domain-containing protein [Salimicrobium flavidum]|uniref:Ig-like domain (Group 2) n=1 Tax=Salimicrobium flavidum TaxID=570947 RepID=A0A1N7IWT5_9BACI|nr:pectate lyase-like adhesive domain-containing protein [Salimicrobium flavidum]SIS41558.1 Ig-like domain (group 2) [Salimicrobium flavidum]
MRFLTFRCCFCAINPSTVEVTFNQEVEGLDKSSFSVMTEDGTKQYVKSVSLDGDTATISFYEALETDTTYDIAITDGETTWETSLDYVLGDVAEIEADTSQTVAAGGMYDLTNLDYTVLDENGQDITEVTNVQFETTFDNDTNSTVDLSSATTGFVYVTATDEDGNEVRSERITLTAEAPEAAQITDYSVGESSLDFDADNYMQDTVVQLGEDNQFLNVDTLNQFGNDYSGDVKFESLDKSTALVDRNTGQITPIDEGTVPVKVTVDGEITTTVELEVVADAQLAEFDLSEDTVSVSDSVSAPTTVNFTARDQYEGKFTTLSESDIDVEVTSGTDLVEANLESYSNGEGTINVVGEEAGTATVTITSGDVEQELTVNVVEAGETEGYEVEGFETQLDKYADSDDDASTDTTMDVAVYPVDANGVKTGDEITNATYTVTKEDGTAVDGYNDVSVGTAIDADDLEADKDYTVSVEVGSFDVFEDTFSVVDTEPKPSVEITNSTISDENGNGYLDDELEELFTTYYAGQEDSADVEAISFQSDNTDVVDDYDGTFDGGDIVAKSQGEASIVIQSVTVDDDATSDNDTTADDFEATQVDVNELVNVVIDGEATVSDNSELTAALANDNVDTVNLENDITGDFTVSNDGVTINGNDSVLTGVLTLGTTNSGNTEAGVENINLNNLTLDGNSDGSSDVTNVVIGYSDKVTFDGVTFQNAEYGIKGQQYGTPSELTVVNSTFDGSYGIAQTEGTGFTQIENNTFTTSSAGIDLGTGVSIEDADDSIVDYLFDNNTFNTDSSRAVGDYTVSPTVTYDDDGNILGS